MGEKIDTNLKGAVLTITLKDESKRNALSRALATEFVAAMDAAEADPAVRVVVVTNTGSVFCAGADLSERLEDDEGASDPLAIFSRIRRSQKPYVGKINGHAIAGGLGLAASMDISVAIEPAKFGFSEVRLGLAPAIISVICLPKMRMSEASDAFLRGNRFDAIEAARLGLINQAVPPEELDVAVDRIVADLLEGGPSAIAWSKRMINDIPAMAFDDAMPYAADVSAQLFSSDEAKEGMASFLEKRPPRWSPKSE